MDYNGGFRQQRAFRLVSFRLWWMAVSINVSVTDRTRSYGRPVIDRHGQLLRATHRPLASIAGRDEHQREKGPIQLISIGSRHLLTLG